MNLKSNLFFKRIIGKKDKYLILIPLAIGLILRLYKLTSSAIWHDEGYTMWLLRYDWWQIIERTARDVHPPGYYLIAKPYVEIFGNSAWSIRFLSLMFSLGIIYFVYRIAEKLFSQRIAFWSALIVAMSPFMVRFGQEARMYGVVGFFTTLGTYLLIRYLDEKKTRFLVFYGLSMLLAIYTQYYAFFVIISHWFAVAIFSPGFFQLKWKESFRKKFGIFDWRWWATNFSLVLLYLPWFPVAYKQVTRVSDNYWIKPEWITIKTIPYNIYQFAIYSHIEKLHSRPIGEIIFWLILIVVIFGVLILIKRNGYKKLLAIYIYGFLPMILVFVLSKLKTPVYQDRYFVFSAVAIFIVWGTAIGLIKNQKARVTVGIIACIILLCGNYVMHRDINHGMERLYEEVKINLKSKDVIVSGELYTYLDGAYYFGCDNIRLMSDGVDGYGETSLFYDQQDKYLVKRESLNSYDRIWVIGKIGEKSYFKSNEWPSYEGEIIYQEDKNNGLKAVLFTRE